MKHVMFILCLSSTIFSPLSAMNYIDGRRRTTSQQRDVLIEQIKQLQQKFELFEENHRLQEENQQLMQALEEDAEIMGAQDQELNRLNQQLAQNIGAEAPAVPAQDAPEPQPQATQPASSWTTAKRIYGANTMINTITGRNILREAFFSAVSFTAKYSKFLPGIVPLLSLLTPAPTHGLTPDNPDFWIGSAKAIARAASRYQ